MPKTKFSSVSRTKEHAHSRIIAVDKIIILSNTQEENLEIQYVIREIRVIDPIPTMAEGRPTWFCKAPSTCWLATRKQFLALPRKPFAHSKILRTQGSVSASIRSRQLQLLAPFAFHGLRCDVCRPKKIRGTVGPASPAGVKNKPVLRGPGEDRKKADFLSGAMRPNRNDACPTRGQTMATSSPSVTIHGTPLITKDRMGGADDVKANSASKRPAQAWSLTDMLGVNDCLAPMFNSRRPVAQQDQLSAMLESQRRKAALEAYVQLLKNGIVMTCHSGVVEGKTELVNCSKLLLFVVFVIR